MKAWLRSEECGGLTVSQNGALVALAAFRSGTPLGQYLERLVKPGSDVGLEGSRQRSLLPLPLCGALDMARPSGGPPELLMEWWRRKGPSSPGSAKKGTEDGQ